MINSQDVFNDIKPLPNDYYKNLDNKPIIIIKKSIVNCPRHHTHIAKIEGVIKIDRQIYYNFHCKLGYYLKRIK